MTSGSDREKQRAVEPLDESLDERIRLAAQAVFPNRIVDDLEMRHLARVVTECSLLLTDVYSDRRIARIMQSDRGLLSSVVDRLCSRERQGEGEVLYRVRRLPDDVRVVGDKALFDLALLGLTQVKGYDLSELGVRAYRVAGEVLELLAEDKRLREFFRQNRLLMLPLEEEVTFLRQCSEKFPLYADILKEVQHPRTAAPGSRPEDLATRVPLMAAAAEALEHRTSEPAAVPLEGRPASDAYVEAAAGTLSEETVFSRDELLSAYERMVLFSSLDMDRVKGALETLVVDQREAVETLCDEFSLHASGTRDLKKPPAYFLVGPTGVGKNHLVESLCRLLEGMWQVKIPVLTIEGPNYTYPSDINELRGATRGFIRSDEDGLLSTFHETASRSPFSVILVDEVEKAHPQLRTFFLSILDRGTTTDNRGRVLNFTNSMIFFTSNLGYSDAQQRSAPIGYLDDEARTEASDHDVHKDIRRELSPEFMNRVRIVRFGRLARASAERILALEFERLAERYRKVHGLRLTLTDPAREELLRRGFSTVFGARHLATTLEAVCNVEVSKRVRRDDRRKSFHRDALVAWLREVRAGGRTFEANEVRRRVLEQVRASLDYDALCIGFENGAFTYDPLDPEPAG
jgi:MoxR-like ATPase